MAKKGEQNAMKAMAANQRQLEWGDRAVQNVTAVGKAALGLGGMERMGSVEAGMLDVSTRMNPQRCGGGVRGCVREGGLEGG